MESNTFVNFPVPSSVAAGWKKFCDAHGFAYGEDLAGLLVLAPYLSPGVHRTAIALATSSFPAPIQDTLRDSLARLGEAAERALPSQSAPVAAAPSTGDTSGPRPRKGRGKTH